MDPFHGGSTGGAGSTGTGALGDIIAGGLSMQNKPAQNPNTYNQPPIPTEGEMTMADVQTPITPMGVVGNEALWQGKGAMQQNII